MIDLKNRYRGCLVGLAVGDALGVPLEFSKRGYLPKVTEMIGQGPFHLQPGEWTDDTSMALCLAQSLIECNGFDAKDQMEKYVNWMQTGYMSSNGRCFDIGNATKESVGRYLKFGNPYAGNTDESSCGNGSIMRLAPIPMLYRKNPDFWHFSENLSRTTHGHIRCMDSCVYLSMVIIRALNGEPKDRLLRANDCGPRLCSEVSNISSGNYKNKTEDQIKSTGYVIDTLEAALWAFYTTNTFEDGCIKVVNLGDDSDTVGAVYGQIAGAYYGYDSIPKKWLGKIVKLDMIVEIADKLLRNEDTSSTP